MSKKHDLEALVTLLGDSAFATLSALKKTGIATGAAKVPSSETRKVHPKGKPESPALDPPESPELDQNPQPASGVIDEEKLVGQAAVKKKLGDIVSISKLAKERRKRGLSVPPITLHAVFQGQPGTGKTTFARLYAQKIREIGLLSKGHLIEVSRDQLVSGYQGQTAATTKAILDKAAGGVLFIDEAYALKKGDDDQYGAEAIDALVKGIEDARDDLIVILAGYTDEMRRFMDHNPGLKSRIPHIVTFEDYDARELMSIFEGMVANFALQVSPQAAQHVGERLERARLGPHFGNARSVRNLFEEAVTQQAARLSKGDLNRLGSDELSELIYSDVTEDPNDEAREPSPLVGDTGNDPLVVLESLIGLQGIKGELRKLKDFVTVSKFRSGTLPRLSLHMVFSGNPGTGKTTVARLLGALLKELGVLPEGHVVEVDRSQLVGEYTGQTAPRTAKKVKEALGGVLFVDEAYSLSQGGHQDAFGREAIDTLVKAMEDERGRFVLVLAGYQEPMNAFMLANPGLRSRFGKVLHFVDYDESEMGAIADLMATKAGMQLAPDAKAALMQHIAKERQAPHAFANARTVRGLLEAAYQRQARRLMSEGKLEQESSTRLSTLHACDFEEQALDEKMPRT